MNSMNGLEDVVKKTTDDTDSVFFQLLTFLKGAAFFWAILMIVIT
jgi:hypothetical protein